MKPNRRKAKPIKKVYIVRWRKQAAKQFGIKERDRILGLEPCDEIKVPCPKTCHKSQFHWGGSLAVFDTHTEARLWNLAAGNSPDFEIKKAILRVEIRPVRRGK